jgi:hypothetical protein
MKFGLTILLLAVVIAINAQTLTDIEKRLRLLGNKTGWTYDSAGLSKLPKLNYDCDDDNRSTWDFYHVIDLNNDGLKDLIYSGPCHPYSQTDIFLNDGMTLRQIHDYPGELVSIDKKTDRTVINIFKEFCCCDYYSDYIQVTIHNDSHIDKNQITFEGNTQIKVDKLTEVKVKGILRTSPELNDKEKKDDCTDKIIKGNHLTYIDKLTTVFQITQSGQWLLILYPVDKMNSWIGWIKVDE